MQLELPQDVVGKMTRALRPFISAELHVEAAVAHLASMPSVTRRQYARLASEAHAAVDHAVQEAHGDVGASIRLAYVRGARANDPDFRLSDNEEDLDILHQQVSEHLLLAHVALDRRLHDVMRRIQLVNLSQGDENTPGLAGALEALGKHSRRPWSLQQHARAALATTGASALAGGFARTANPASYDGA